MKTVSTKDFMIFLKNLGVNTANQSLKYEVVYLFTDILEHNCDDDEFLDLILKDEKMAGGMVELVLTMLEPKAANTNLIKITLSLVDILFSLENEFEENIPPNIEHESNKFINLLIEEGILELFDSIAPFNKKIQDKVNEI